MKTSPAIAVENLSKTFKGDIRALDGVSFSVEPGTIFGLLGPNGAGKTTAVRILTTILRPDGGVARVLGHDVAHEPARVRTLIGLAGQFAAVDENLTGYENLRMIGQLSHLRRREAAARGRELLGQFDLADAANRPVKTYSGGMRRRLDVAAALVDRPPVLFLDEPTTGLDPFSRISLWRIIEGLVEDGATVLLTTQYLEEADRLADNLVVVDHGRVIAEGTSAELKAGLGASVLDLDMVSDAEAEKALSLLESGQSRSPTRRDMRVEVPLERGALDVIDTLRILDAAGIVPTALSVREPSLDDVFLSLTGHAAET